MAAVDFEKQYVYKKYTNKKFLRASTFARDWARTHVAKDGAYATRPHQSAADVVLFQAQLLSNRYHFAFASSQRFVKESFAHSLHTPPIIVCLQLHCSAKCRVSTRFFLSASCIASVSMAVTAHSTRGMPFDNVSLACRSSISSTAASFPLL
jgi:hypothetical protein